MSGLDKIIEDIRKESAETVNGIMEKAKGEADGIMAKAREDAAVSCDAVKKESTRRLNDAGERAKSAAELSRRKQILEAKQELIADVIKNALSKLAGEPDEEYFRTVTAMAVRSAHPGEEGEILFGENDLKRLPKDFESRLNAGLSSGKITVSAKPADIRNGFLLMYGGIEENCSFDAVFSARHEEMQDIARKILFGGAE